MSEAARIANKECFAFYIETSSRAVIFRSASIVQAFSSNTEIVKMRSSLSGDGAFLRIHVQRLLMITLFTVVSPRLSSSAWICPLLSELSPQ